MSTFPTIPTDLLPADGRFGAGPSKVRKEQIDALVAAGPALLGTSHRQAPVKNLVGSVQEGLLEFFQAPDGYEVVLGIGGSTAFWDIASFGLIETKAQHLSFGEFGSKFAAATNKAPFLAASVHHQVPSRAPAPSRGCRGRRRCLRLAAERDLHGRRRPGHARRGRRRRCPDAGRRHLRRRRPGRRRQRDRRLLLRPAEELRLRRRPVARRCSPRPRWSAPSASPHRGRWIPDFLDLKTAIDNSTLNQTYNTPSLATLVPSTRRCEWLNGNGGLDWAAARTADSASRALRLGRGLRRRHPVRGRPGDRSNVIATIDLDDSIDAAAVAKALRANGVVDTEPYRKLGRNQLRVATFVAIEPDDVSALTRCIDYVIENL